MLVSVEGHLTITLVWYPESECVEKYRLPSEQQSKLFRWQHRPLCVYPKNLQAMSEHTSLWFGFLASQFVSDVPAKGITTATFVELNLTGVDAKLLQGCKTVIPIENPVVSAIETSR